MTAKPKIILGIESSCDDTAAAILVGNEIRANIIAGQAVHEKFGGVVPELASRAHQENIIPVVQTALQTAQISLSDLDAIAFTRKSNFSFHLFFSDQVQAVANGQQDLFNSWVLTDFQVELAQQDAVFVLV